MNIQEAAKQATNEKRYMTREQSIELLHKKIKPTNGAGRCMAYRTDVKGSVRAWLPSLSDLMADDWIVVD